MTRKAGTAFALLCALLALGCAPAAASGGQLAPVQDRYEPGVMATLLGYTVGPAPKDTFYAYFRPVDGGVPALDDAGEYVGELAVQETRHVGYLALRVSVTFDVPEALPPGEYEVTYCDDPCTGTFLGDLAPSPLSIGVDPVRSVVRHWAPDEPEIANLAAGAILVGPGFRTTASVLRAPATTVAPAPPGPAGVPPPAQALPAPAVATGDGEMAWPLPIALVLASSAGTALVLNRRQRAGASRPPAVPSGRPGGAFAGRG